MTVGCNIWMICLKLNRFFYGLSSMLHLSEFVWIIRTSVLVVFNNFLLIGATDRSKIRSDQKRFFIVLSLYPLSFFANTPFNGYPRREKKSGLGQKWKIFTVDIRIKKSGLKFIHSKVPSSGHIFRDIAIKNPISCKKAKTPIIWLRV